jgi:hypothetical protein
VHYETTVPAIKDRVAQTGAVIVLEAIFEADLTEEQLIGRQWGTVREDESSFTATMLGPPRSAFP